MKTEDLLRYLENEENFEEVDSFEEYLSGCGKTRVYVLYAALSHWYDDLIERKGNMIYLNHLEELCLIAKREYYSR